MISNLNDTRLISIVHYSIPNGFWNFVPAIADQVLDELKLVYALPLTVPEDSGAYLRQTNCDLWIGSVGSFQVVLVRLPGDVETEVRSWVGERCDLNLFAWNSELEAFCLEDSLRSAGSPYQSTCRSLTNLSRLLNSVPSVHVLENTDPSCSSDAGELARLLREQEIEIPLLNFETRRKRIAEGTAVALRRSILESMPPSCENPRQEELKLALLERRDDWKKLWGPPIGMTFQSWLQKIRRRSH